MSPEQACLFCEIAEGARESHLVYTDEDLVAFLDHRPLFPGHVLLIPRAHHPTLADLPKPLVQPFFLAAQLLARAVEQAMAAQGTFIAINNRVSQSLPHLHAHIVPRNKGDGLKGFFWPRRRYTGEAHMRSVQEAIRRAVASLRMLVALLLAAELAGCAGTVETLEKKGVEFEKGKVLRVFRF